MIFNQILSNKKIENINFLFQENKFYLKQKKKGKKMSDPELIKDLHHYKYKYLNIFIAVLCRFMLILVGIYYVYLIACFFKMNIFYGLLSFTLVIIADVLYICIRREGIDYKW